MRHPWRSVALLPAMRIFIFMAFGIALQWSAPLPPKTLWSASIAFLTAAIIVLRPGAFRPAWKPTLRLVRDISLLALMTTVGMILCMNALRSFPLDLLRFADQKEKVVLRGTVAADPRSAPDRQRFPLDVSRIISCKDTTAIRGRILLSYGRSQYDKKDTLLPLRIGDVIEVRCRLRVPRPPRNPHAFDARSWLLQEGILLQASASKGGDLRITGNDELSWWKHFVSGVRHGLRSAVAGLYSPTHAAVMNGLLLGDRSGIAEETLDDFRRSGIMHILAVSGLHAGIVLMMVFVPLERLRFPLRAAAALTALWLFAAITGFAPPVTRASLMATLFLGGVLLQRAGSSINALAVAGILIAAFDPLAILGLSFQLSFGAVLGILLFHDRIQRALTALLPKRLRGKASDTLLSLIALTVAAQTLTMPLLAGNFGQISAVGLLTNVVAVPLVFVVVCCGILSVTLFPLWTGMAQLFAATSGTALDLILASSDFFAAFPGGVIDLPALPSAIMILYVGAIAYLSATPGRMRQKLSLLSIFIVTAVISGTMLFPSPQAKLRVTFLDVGQGDAILIEIPGSDAWLIDTGPGGDRGNSGTQVILPHLRANGIRRLAGLVITHPDDDHRGGAAAVLNAVTVDSAYLSCTWPATGESGALRKLMTSRTRGVRDVRAGDMFTIGKQARLYVLSPPADIDCTPSNGNSVVLMLIYGSTRFLFTGDADVEAERRMIARYDSFLRADVLKVGHHGSTTSTSPGFAVKVKPKHAVITVGRNNHFNHPRQEVLNRLRLVGAKVHRTDLEGAVIFESDGESLTKLRWSK
ncbi:MAG: DNA internalization-related competence protein ComEC/Rec2 [Bacteroidota bacterium]